MSPDGAVRAPRRTLKLTNLPPKGEIKAVVSSVSAPSFCLVNAPISSQGPRTPSRIDPNNPPWPAYRGYHEYSFAHVSCDRDDAPFV